MNDINLLGRLTNTPELKQSANGRPYTWFTMAVPRQDNRKEADYIRCLAFDKLANAIYRDGYTMSWHRVSTHGYPQSTPTCRRKRCSALWRSI